MLLEALISISVVVGSIFILVGAIGLVRLGDLYSRLHGPTKATTLGMGGLLLGSLLLFSDAEAGISVHEILVSIFLFLTAPVSAHMVARAGLQMRVETITEPLDERYRDVFPGAVDPDSEPPPGTVIEPAEPGD